MDRPAETLAQVAYVAQDGEVLFRPWNKNEPDFIDMPVIGTPEVIPYVNLGLEEGDNLFPIFATKRYFLTRFRFGIGGLCPGLEEPLRQVMAMTVQLRVGMHLMERLVAALPPGPDPSPPGRETPKNERG